MSIDMQSALDADMAVIHEDGRRDYVETDAEVYAAESSAQEVPNVDQTQPEQEQTPVCDSSNEDAASRFFS